MLLSWVFTVILLLSLIFSIFFGVSPAAAVTQGAQAGITLAISIGGSLCLWSGVGHLMEKLGLTDKLSRLFLPLLRLVFPSCKNDPTLRGALSANICANLLGLGNAATPMGIRAAQGISALPHASEELARFVVLNTASIQLFPTTVASIRSSLGASAPMDILPCVLLTSLGSVAAGLAAVKLLHRR